MINKVILVGNVGADPEIRTLESGVKVARVRLATTERIYSRERQEATEHTEWHSITLWRNMADVADRFVRKGSQIYVEGALRTREWTDQQGAKHYSTEIVANDMKLLGRKPESTAPAVAPAPQQYAPAPSGQQYSPAANVATPAATVEPVAPALPDENPDDLPF